MPTSPFHGGLFAAVNSNARNNSLWDLFHLIRFFARQDAFLADRGVLSVYDRLHQAMREDRSNLSPDLLYPVKLIQGNQGWQQAVEAKACRNVSAA